MFTLELLTLDEYVPKHKDTVRLFLRDSAFGIGYDCMKTFDVEMHYAEYKNSRTTGHSVCYDGDENIPMHHDLREGMHGGFVAYHEKCPYPTCFRKEWYFTNGNSQIHPGNEDHGIIGIIDAVKFKKQMDDIYHGRK